MGATQDMESTWPAAFFIVEMLSPRMSTLPLQSSRLRGASNLLIGAPPDSRLASTTNPPPLFLAEIWPKCLVQSACSLIPLRLLRLGLDLTISLISCTPRGPLFIGMSERAWKRENSLKLVKIWLLWKRITRKVGWTLSMAKKTLGRSIKSPRKGCIFFLCAAASYLLQQSPSSQFSPFTL